MGGKCLRDVFVQEDAMKLQTPWTLFNILSENEWIQGDLFKTSAVAPLEQAPRATEPCWSDASFLTFNFQGARVVELHFQNAFRTSQRDTFDSNVSPSMLPSKVHPTTMMKKKERQSSRAFPFLSLTRAGVGDVGRSDRGSPTPSRRLERHDRRATLVGPPLRVRPS